MKLTINNNYQEDKSFLLYVKDEYIGELNTINSSAICDIEKEINICRIWVKEKLATRGKSISKSMNPFE